MEIRAVVIVMNHLKIVDLAIPKSLSGPLFGGPHLSLNSG